MLDGRERVMLVSGEGLRMLNSVDAIEIREKLGVGWLKSEDRDALGLKVGLLITQAACRQQRDAAAGRAEVC